MHTHTTQLPHKTTSPPETDRRSTPALTALHMHAAAAALPAGEDESLGQLAHVLEDAAPAAAE